MHIWVLEDNRAGNVNQLLGVAMALSDNYTEKKVIYDMWVRLPNCLRRGLFLGVKNKAVLQSPQSPDIILTAGRRLFPVALKLKRQFHNHPKVVCLMNPGAYGRGKADLLCLPQHDKAVSGDNVVRFLGAPHRIYPEVLANAQQKWMPFFQSYPRPAIALIVGGATKDKAFTLADAKQLVLQLKAQKPGSVWVSTSRRTPPDVVDFLQRSLPHPLFFYRFGSKDENPYFGLLSCADKIVVTGDSISMCSECCATGKPVFIFAPDTMISTKHQRFIQSLYDGHFATPFGERPKQTAVLPNAATVIAQEIKHRFLGDKT